MIRKRERRGFTLVELLVVISIIGMLVAMLLPAVQAAREAGRRAECMNKQRQWGLALQQYDSSKGRFPGYYGWVGKNKVPGQPSPYYWGGWMVSVFPYIEKANLWERWSIGYGDPRIAPDESYRYAWVNLDEGRCPSSPLADAAGETSFSYRVNTGRLGTCSYTDTNNVVEDVTATGVFDVDIPADAQGGGVLWTTSTGGFVRRRGLSLSTIRDGTASTLMISENTQDPASWAEYRANTADSLVTSADAFNQLLRGQGTAGAVAEATGYSVETRFGFCIPQISDTANYQSGMQYINQQFDDPNRFARPASYHPGGVVVVFCDNHAGFLSDNVDVPVFIHLMTSNSRRAAEVAYASGWAYYPLLFIDQDNPALGVTTLDSADY